MWTPWCKLKKLNISWDFFCKEPKLCMVVTLITKFHVMFTVTFPWQHNVLQVLSIQRVESGFSPFKKGYLTIFPQAWMGYWLRGYEGERNNWLRGYKGERNNCFSKIQLVGQKNIETRHLSQVKVRYESFFTAKTLQIWRALFATSGL